MRTIRPTFFPLCLPFHQRASATIPGLHAASVRWWLLLPLRAGCVPVSRFFLYLSRPIRSIEIWLLRSTALSFVHFCK